MKLNLFQKDELKHLGPFYLAAFMTKLFLFWYIFYIFYFRDLGFSFTQIGSLIAISSISMMLFEVPTGSIADSRGRKFSVLFGLFIVGLCFLGIYFLRDFYHIAIVFIIWGFGSSMISGANVSWIVDNLKFKKKSNLIDEFFSKSQSIFNLGILLSSLLGAFLVKEFGMSIIWLSASVAMTVQIAILLFIKEYRIASKIKKKSSAYMKESLKFALNKKHIKIFLLITVFSFAYGSFGGNAWLWQIMFEDMGMKPYFFGYIMSISGILGIGIPLLVKRTVKKFGGHRNTLIFVEIATFLVVVSVSLVTSWQIGALVLLLVHVLYDLGEPTFEGFWHKFLPSNKRATLDSLDSMVGSLIAALTLPLAGLLADTIGTQHTIVIGAFFLLPVIYLYTKLPKKK